MNVGDLVRFRAQYALKLNPNEELGIITKTDPIGMPSSCHVEWFNCDNRGWWSYKNLELVNANR